MSHTFDNCNEHKQVVNIDGKNVEKAPDYNEWRVYVCIMCHNTMNVASQDPTLNNSSPMQTLFCPDCYEKLERIFERERNGDYGW